MAKQTEILKREVIEEREKVSRLIHMEEDMRTKVDAKDKELERLRVYNNELEDSLLVKTEAIEKAQKVIQMLNDGIDKN
jgi:hypothetical protein